MRTGPVSDSNRLVWCRLFTKEDFGFQVRRDKSTCENTKEENYKLTAHEPECKTHAKQLIYCIADTR